jgi:hypothetical protein
VVWAKTVTTDVNGFYYITGIPETKTTVAARVTVLAHTTTYRWDLAIPRRDLEYRLPSVDTWNAFLDLVPPEFADPLAGQVAGTVYWSPGAYRPAVGCATVTTNPANTGHIYYMNADGYPDNTLTGTTPDVGRYWSINHPEDQAVTVTAAAPGGTEEGTAHIALHSTLTLVDVYFGPEYTENPQGGSCGTR